MVQNVPLYILQNYNILHSSVANFLFIAEPSKLISDIPITPTYENEKKTKPAYYPDQIFYIS
jgi:hypothetical protein